MAKQMKTLNGYEVVDQAARDKISNLSTEIDTHKITLRSTYNNILGNIVAKEANLGDSFQGGNLISIPSVDDKSQLFERGYKVPTLVAILKRDTEMEVSTNITTLRFGGATVFDSMQGSYISESDGYGYFKIKHHGAYKITVRVKWGQVSKNTAHTIGVVINDNPFINEIDYVNYSFTNYNDISDFTTILILNMNDTIKLRMSSTMAQKAYQARMYIERVA